VDVEVVGGRRRAPPVVEDQLFRVGQEALANALKHARPRAVSIRLTYDRHAVRLVVEDDGRGWSGPPPASADGGGLGLVGMRERMDRIGGSLEVTSRPGRGTRVVATVPLDATERPRP
jgi:signal transduction histidine kinase